ncbi:MAG: rRNA pseudouridine synthase [Holosporales bacterium]|jgi:23S rRNA pseudouridine2605 synthase|nr:rRNA pseudouridine synthase [Holosporales bacterium]
MDNKTRLNKALSMLGICSRRDADALILKEGVYVNGKLAREVGSKVSDEDVIFVNGKEYVFSSLRQTRIWLYYKPVGLITSHKDPKNRRTVFEDVSNKIGERVISVGRLDINSEGLLLLTNDGEFARFAESPQTAWERRYKVRLFGMPNKEVLSQLGKGVTINGVRYAPIVVNFLKQTSGKNCWVECVLKEGKNREIRKIFNHFDILVNKLIRTQYGSYFLGNLKPGEIVEAKPRP